MAEVITTEPRLTRLTSLEAARAKWTHLAETQDNVFATWEWASTWWRAWGSDSELFLHEVTIDGSPVGILPLYKAPTPVGPILRFIGHGPADQLGPVCSPAHRDVVSAAMLDLLAERMSPQMLLAERLPAGEHWFHRLGARRIRTESSPVIDLDGISWDEWLAEKSSNFRQQVGRRERRLAREHDLEYRLVTDPEEVPSALCTLIDLHNARWGGSSTAFEPPALQFHYDFAHTAAARGWLRLWLAMVDGQAAAAWLGYRFGGIENYYQLGRDPSIERHSVGFILLMHTIREAANDGVAEYRLLGGGEEYKDRLLSRDPGVETCVVGSGVLPVIAHAVARHKHLLPSPAKRAISTRLGW